MKLEAGAEILSLRSFVEDGGGCLKQLLSRSAGPSVSKVHPGGISPQCLETLGFRAVGVHRLYAARAQAD